MGVHYLSPRPKNSHKGDFGHVLVVGGDYGMAGSCRLAGEAALRTGAGLVSVATRPEHAYAMAGSCPELMCHGIVRVGDLDPLLERATVIVFGTGLGQGVWAKALFNHVIQTELPLILDADGLSILATKPLQKSNWVLTPHPGEAGKLLDCSATEIQRDRTLAIKKLQMQYEGVVVLKGSGTLVLGPSGELETCKAGNPAMATAGMGDVLTGVIAGLVAQKMLLEQAAFTGVCLHATAGDKAAYGYERGLMARDLIPYLNVLL
ncbi:MAG: NAD(P)H-hydrate dehydratase [Myxococcaceae bacterium]